MSPEELIDKLESLAPADLEQLIGQQRERLSRMELLHKILTGSKKITRSRRSGRMNGSVSDANGESPPPLVDRTLPAKERVRAFLSVNGPAKFQQIMAACAVSPVELSNITTGPHCGFIKRDDKTFALK